MQFGRGQWLMRRAAGTALAIAASVSTATLAQAACTPGAVDAATPAPGSTVTCSGNTVDQNLDAGYGAGNQTGITINVGDGASVVSNAKIGMWVGDALINNGVGSTILGRTNGIVAAPGSLAVSNYGSITGTTGTGISASSNVTLTNQAGGAILGAVDGIKSTTGSITLDNAGSLIGTNASAIDAFTDITVINRAGGVISGGPGAIFARTGNVTLDNAGSITSAGTTVSAFDSVKLINRAGATISGSVIGGTGLDVNNSGNIDGVGGQNAKVVNTATGTIGIIGITGGTGDIDNFGTVTNSVSGAGSLVNHAGGSIAGVAALNMSITNSGAIGGISVALGGGLQLVNNAGASIASVLTNAASTAASISNAGTISGSIVGIQFENGGNTVTNLAGGNISGTSSGIALLVSGNTVANLAGGNITGGASGVLSFLDASITNSGTISATAAPGAGLVVVGALQLVNTAGASISGPDYGIAAGGNSSIVNAGSISGGTAAIRFAAGGNTLTLLPGSVISGKVIGFGSDTLQLGGIGAANFDISQLGLDPTLQYSGFTTLNKVDSSLWSLWSLTGDSTYAGPVNVNGGTLAVNGNLAAANLLTVNAGGILGGNGVLGATVINGGTLAPGNSIGTLTMSSLNMTPASTYLVQVSGAASDRTIVTGTAAIAGKVSVDPLTRLTSTTTYTIVNAGTLTGTFDNASLTNNFGRNARLSYAGNNVLLTLDPGMLSPALMGRGTFNQNSVAAGIDSTIAGGVVLPGSFDALFALSGDPLLDALSQLSGEIHASAKSALIEESHFVRDAINDRLRAAFDGAGASLAPVLAYGPGEMPMLVAPDHGGLALWSHGFGSWGEIEGDGNAASLDHSTGGLLIGADSLVGDWRIGLLAGYSYTGLEVADRSSSGSNHNYHIGLYGGTEWGNLAFRSGLAYTWHDLSTNRSVTIPGLTNSLSAHYNAGTLQAFGELGYGIDMGSTRFEPFANLAYVNLHNGGFAEQGGAVRLSGASSATGVTFTTLGLRAEHALTLGTIDATLRGMVGWRHAFGDTTPKSALAFSVGDAFTIAGTPIARDGAVVEAGLDMKLTPDATFGLSYIGQLSGTAQDHGLKANLNVRF